MQCLIFDAPHFDSPRRHGFSCLYCAYYSVVNYFLHGVIIYCNLQFYSAYTIPPWRYNYNLLQLQSYSAYTILIIDVGLQSAAF
jgi:hypothetical protein